MVASLGAGEDIGVMLFGGGRGESNRRGAGFRNGQRGGLARHSGKWDGLLSLHTGRGHSFLEEGFRS